MENESNPLNRIIHINKINENKPGNTQNSNLFLLKSRGLMLLSTIINETLYLNFNILNIYCFIKCKTS